MNALPIVARELRVAARRGMTFWLRSGVALAVIFFAIWIIIIGHEETTSPVEIGRVLFYMLTGAGQLYCLFAGVRFTADCLAEEKREGTLGLLFLTDLRGYDVVFGKLVASSLNAFYGLLAVVPVMGLPLLMGGITPGEFGRLMLVLVNTLFFSLAAGMLASAFAKSVRGSIGLAITLILSVTLVFPLLATWLWFRNGGAGGDPWPCWLISPGFSYAAGVDEAFKNLGPNPFLLSQLALQVMAWGFLALSSVITPRSWQDAPKAGKLATVAADTRSWMEGDGSEQKAFRARTLDINAWFWLATRPRSRPIWVVLTLLLFGAGWAWGALKFGRDWFNEPIYVLTALLLNSLLKCWIASESSRRILEDRRAGSMELLLSTPLTVEDVVRGQRLALTRQFLIPLVIVVVAELVMLFAGASHTSFRGERGWWFAIWGAASIVAVADIPALFWVGLWRGLASRSPKLALSGVIMRILVVPWIAFFAFVTLVALANIGSSGRGGGEEMAVFILIAWTLICLINSFLFGAGARHNFLAEFRERAAQRYQAAPSLLKRIFGS